MLRGGGNGGLRVETTEYMANVQRQHQVQGKGMRADDIRGEKPGAATECPDPESPPVLRNRLILECRIHAAVIWCCWGENDGLRVETTKYMANVQRQHQVQGEEREQMVSMARKP